eukprot:Gb_38594 [translate_table: standard]
MVTADLEGGEQEQCICHLVAAEKPWLQGEVLGWR